MLELSSASKSFKLPDGRLFQILRDTSIEIERGESVAIRGRSGSGKSTLLHGLGLLDPFDSGSYRVEGVEAIGLDDHSASRLRGRTFGFVFQQYYLFDRRTALANVVAPAQHAPPDEYRQAHRVAMDLLRQVGLGDRSASLPSQLSGGEQQRVTIARSLVRSPTYIFADEPTGSLDPANADSILDLLFRVSRDRGCALVIVTHDEAVARRADRRLELVGGVLRASP